MIIGIDEVGNFDPNSDMFHYFAAVLIDQNKNKLSIKESQYKLWEDTIPAENRDEKGEVKGQLLTNEQLVAFYKNVLEPKPSVLYTVVRIKPSENPKEVLDKHQKVEVDRIQKNYELHQKFSKGNWAEWYERILYWYKNRKYAHLLKMRCLEHIIGLSFNHAIGWAQLTYLLDDKDDSNIKDFTYKIDKDFIKAENTKTIWNELLRQFWKSFSYSNRSPILDIWEKGTSPVEQEYEFTENKAKLKKIFSDRTFFVNSEEHFEIRMADILGTILHRYQNKGQNEEIHKEIIQHLGGKRKNYSHLILNPEVEDISELSQIRKRQHFYWLGRKHKENGDIEEAIDAYLTYSTYLDPNDEHIPHQWVSDFYSQLGDIENSLFHLEVFAKGCSPPKAAEVYKEIGEKNLELNSIEKAVLNFENAIENNPNIGVKKKLDELKNSLYV